MNVLKNMEAIFLVSAVLLCAAGYASANVSGAPVNAPAIKVAQIDNAQMQIVTVSAKRLTAAEKAVL